MTQPFESRLRSVDRAVLMPLVQRVLHRDIDDLLTWDHGPLAGGFSQEHGESYGIYRFHGHAQTADGPRPWSLILKATGRSLTGSPDPASFTYWQREALVYRSGLLDALPGALTAPRCLGITTHADEDVWLWLEDVVDLEDEAWPVARFEQVARQLGHLSGTYAAPRTLPAVPWLSTGDLDTRLALAQPGIPQLADLSRHPFFAQFLPDEVAPHILALWQARERLLAVRRRVPVTLCHHDAFRRNILTRRGAGGREETVLIDWTRTGTGVLGEELVPLFVAGLRFIPVELTQIAALDAAIFANYVDGLRATGWHGDPVLVRFGFTATAALKGGVADPAIKLPSVARRVADLPANAEPPRILGPGLEQHIALHRHLLRMGDEALALTSRLA